MIGKLDERVRIYSQPTTDDGMGGSYVSSTIGTEYWANVKEKGQNKQYTDNTILHDRNIKITLRKNETFDETYVIEWNSRSWTINDIYSDEKYTYVNCYE